MRGSCTRCGAVHPRRADAMPSRTLKVKVAADLTWRLDTAFPEQCEHCGDPAQEATYEGRWLCDGCLYLAEFNSPESRADRWYDESKYDV